MGILYGMTLRLATLSLTFQYSPHSLLPLHMCLPISPYSMGQQELYNFISYSLTCIVLLLYVIRPSYFNLCNQYHMPAIYNSKALSTHSLTSNNSTDAMLWLSRHMHTHWPTLTILTQVFVHAGPFANIAHGNSSILADKVLMRACHAIERVLIDSRACIDGLAISEYYGSRA